MNWQALVKDKRVLVAGAAGAGLGLWALVKRKGAAGTGTSAAASTGGTGPGTIGAYDSSATDAYNNFESTLEQYGQQITSIQDQLTGLQNPATGGAPTTNTGGGSTGPVAKQPVKSPVTAKPAPKPAMKYATVGSGNIHETLGKLMDKYHLTLSQVRNLNPSLKTAGRNTKLKPGTKWRIA